MSTLHVQYCDEHIFFGVKTETVRLQSDCVTDALEMLHNSCVVRLSM
jgi:hypothetical protein